MLGASMDDPTRREANGAARERALASVRRLRARAAAVPGCLAELARIEVPRLDGPVVTTGVGQSTGPAEILADALRGRGIRADSRRLSRFLVPGSSEDATLVVFSQGLSPNATLALARAAAFRRTLLVTSAKAPALPGVEVVEVPCPSESESLLRVAGPLVAATAALRLAGALAPPDLPVRVERALAAGGPALGSASLVLSPSCLPTARAVGWLLLEATGRWALATDALELAHGPLQSIYEREASLLCLRSSADPPGIWDRVAAVLVPERHTLVSLDATLDPPWASVEHLARAIGLLLADLEREPRDLSHWPAQGLDGPLYGMSARLT